MPELTIDQAFQLAIGHHQAGEIQEAENLYRQILARQPKHAAALHHLGLIACQAGRLELAVELIRQSLAINPNQAGA